MRSTVVTVVALAACGSPGVADLGASRLSVDVESIGLEPSGACELPVSARLTVNGVEAEVRDRGGANPAFASGPFATSGCRIIEWRMPRSETDQALRFELTDGVDTWVAEYGVVLLHPVAVLLAPSNGTVKPADEVVVRMDGLDPESVSGAQVEAWGAEGKKVFQRDLVWAQDDGLWHAAPQTCSPQLCIGPLDQTAFATLSFSFRGRSKRCDGFAECLPVTWAGGMPLGELYFAG